MPMKVCSRWFWYFPIILKRGSSPDESEYSDSWFAGIFKTGILTKYSLNIFAICLSCEIIWLSSIKVTLETFLDSSAEKGLTVFQKVLFSVKTLVLRLRWNFLFFLFSLN